MSGGTSSELEAGVILHRFWDTSPLLALCELNPADVPFLATREGLALQRIPAGPLAASIMHRGDGSAPVLAVDSRLHPAAQNFHAIARIAAWADGAARPRRAHRIAAAACLLPDLGEARLCEILLTDDFSLGADGAAELVRQAARAVKLARNQQDSRYCLARGKQAGEDMRRRESVAWYVRSFIASGADAECRAQASHAAAKVLIDMRLPGDAVTVLQRGLEVASAAGLTELEARHHHTLLKAHAAMENLKEAEECGERAASLYPEGHPNVPWLANDMGAIWAAQDFVLRAYAVFRGVGAAAADPELRAAANANAAKAAAKLGSPERFLSHTFEARRSHARVSRPNKLSPGVVLVALADGAQTAGIWGMAEELVGMAKGEVNESGTEEVTHWISQVREARADQLARTLLDRVRAMAA